jgi:hypothetical protein
MPHSYIFRCGYNAAAGKPEGKISFGRSGHKWEDDIKMDLKETGHKSMYFLWKDQLVVSAVS